jgi:hypothetical protein
MTEYIMSELAVVPEQIRAAIYRARMNELSGDPEFHVTNGEHRGYYAIRIERDGLSESHYGSSDTCAAFIDGYVAAAMHVHYMGQRKRYANMSW